MAKAPTEIATKFAELLTEKFTSAENARTEGNPNAYVNDYSLTAVAGRRFDKIVMKSRVFAFIERETGDLYKAASYNAPAKNVRFGSESVLTSAVELADPYGSFLYL